MLIGRVTTWMRFVRTSAVSLILPTMIESSFSEAARISKLLSPVDSTTVLAGRAVPAGVTGRATGAAPGALPLAGCFSKIAFNFSSTSLASARSSAMNSLTTSAGGTSISCRMCTRPRTVALFSVMSSACALGRARDVGVAPGDWPMKPVRVCCSSVGSA